MANKIGIVTWHYYGNFGSALQAFALQKLISDMGYDVKIINYRNPLLDKRIWWKTAIKFLLHNTVGFFNKRLYMRTARGVRKFQKHYLCQTKRFSNPKQIVRKVRGYSYVIYGSDQIWAPNAYNPVYMGVYIPDGIRKISYAASIGLNDIPKNIIEVYKHNLSSYYAISVREEEGKKLLKSKCGIEAKVVLDPTLMIDVEVYRKMQKPVKKVKGRFAYCYFLNKEHCYREKVEEYAQKHHLQIIGSSDKILDSEWMERLVNIGADQFLWLINNADVVFTDSYHGCIFSLLFHKNLWAFMRFDENSPICQNSRMRQLQNNFNISHRIISVQQDIDDTKHIDYNYIEKKLKQLQIESLNYLKNALI